tara:strand:- start:20393 stop:21133 length:741 start_codon:yes stop_codon:yes gene_type:complete
MFSQSVWKKAIRFAVHEHYQSFYIPPGTGKPSDKMDLDACRRGNLTGDYVMAIAGRYKVARGVVVKKGNRSENADAIASAVNALSNSNWANQDLKIRALECQKIAEELCKPGVAKNGGARTEGKQVSLVSKLAWFVEPDGWTLYDSLASAALGVNSFEKFYCALDTRGFFDLSAQLNAELATSPHKDLFGERIIDKFLWVCGQSMAGVDRFLRKPEIASRKHPKSVDDLANAIAANHANDFIKLLG